MHPSRIAYIAALVAPGLCFALDITTTDGVTYQGCAISKVEPDGLKITHAVGLARIPYEKLPKELQDQYFDAEKVAAYRKQVEAQREEAAAAARKLAAMKPGVYRFHHDNILGTSMDLQVFASGETEAQEVEAVILAEIERLRKILSTYDEASDISKVNASESPVVCPRELLDVLALYESWAAKSKGAYSGHIGELDLLWKEAEKTGTPPDAAALQPVLQQLSQPGWKLDPAAGSVTRLGKQRLNVDSLGKGFIIDKALSAAKLKFPSVQGLFLNIGGDIQATGVQSPGVPWKVGVANPLQSADNAPPLTELKLSNRAISSSGGYQRGYTVAGKHYSHILNPQTGQPAQGVAGATVVSSNPANANALAATLCVLDPQEGLALVKQTPDTECLIVTPDGRQFRSDKFATFEVNPPAGSTPAPAAPAAAVTKSTADDPSKWPDNYKASISITLLTPTKFKNVGPKVKDPNRRPFIALWVTNANNERVRTITAWGKEPKHIHELSEWWKENKQKAAWALGIAKATRSPGQYTIDWDGLDDKQAPLPQGTYTIFFEVNREYGDHETQSVQMVCGKSPSQATIPASSEAGETQITYGPATPSS